MLSLRARRFGQLARLERGSCVELWTGLPRWRQEGDQCDPIAYPRRLETNSCGGRRLLTSGRLVARTRRCGVAQECQMHTPRSKRAEPPNTRPRPLHHRDSGSTRSPELEGRASPSLASPAAVDSNWQTARTSMATAGVLSSQRERERPER